MLVIHLPKNDPHRSGLSSLGDKSSRAINGNSRRCGEAGTPRNIAFDAGIVYDKRFPRSGAEKSSVSKRNAYATNGGYWIFATFEKFENQ